MGYLTKLNISLGRHFAGIRKYLENILHGIARKATCVRDALRERYQGYLVLNRIAYQVLKYPYRYV